MSDFLQKLTVNELLVRLDLMWDLSKTSKLVSKTCRFCFKRRFPSENFHVALDNLY